MNCKKCGQDVDKKAVICPGCGCKITKPIFKKWWFWVLIVIVIAVIAGNGKNAETSNEDENTSFEQTQQISTSVTEEVQYEQVDLQTMFDDLDANAMKAESKYQKKYVEFVADIASFDSDGKYIAVEPVGASEWNLITATCYIKNDTQKAFLIEKNVGDTITIKGKVKSIGELLGYSFDINEVY